MSIDFVFRIAAIGILVSVLSQVLSRAGREDIATLIALSGLVIVLMMVAEVISDFFVDIRAMFGI